MVSQSKNEVITRFRLEETITSIARNAFGQIDSDFCRFATYAAGMYKPFMRYPKDLKLGAYTDDEATELTVCVVFPSTYFHGLCTYSNEDKSVSIPKNKNKYYSLLEFVVTNDRLPDDMYLRKIARAIVFSMRDNGYIRGMVKAFEPEDVKIAKKILKPFITKNL